jgi:hypothetical protein
MRSNLLSKTLGWSSMNERTRPLGQPPGLASFPVPITCAIFDRASGVPRRAPDGERLDK